MDHVINNQWTITICGGVLAGILEAAILVILGKALGPFLKGRFELTMPQFSDDGLQGTRYRISSCVFWLIVCLHLGFTVVMAGVPIAVFWGVEPSPMVFLFIAILIMVSITLMLGSLATALLAVMPVTLIIEAYIDKLTPPPISK